MKEIELRPPQIIAVNMARNALRKHKRVILNAGTGFGKSITSVYIGKESAAKGNNIIFLVHRQEILHQFFKTFRDFGITPSLIIPGKKHMPNQPIYLGMVETFRRRMKHHGFIDSLNAKLLVCDEVHWGSYESVVNNFPNYVLGLTASPKSSSGAELNTYFDDCFCPITVPDLIREGWLLPARTFSIEHDFSGVPLKGKDFNIDALCEEFKKPKLFEGLLDQYQMHADGEKAICYSVNVERSIAACNMFRDAGYKAWHVDANSTHREDIFAMFAESEDAILFNVGIATTGYDEPTVRCLLKNFATAQITKNTQVDGRGARLCPEIGKKEFKIIDMGRNYMRHGMFGEDIDWLGIFNNPKLAKTKKEESSISNIECILCGAIIRMNLNACPYCDTVISKERKEEKILEQGTTKEIKEYRIQQLPVHLRGKKPGQMSYSELIEFAKHMNYSPKWVHVQQRFRK
jgi:superfamily II DNA or RNA helicase